MTEPIIWDNRQGAIGVYNDSGEAVPPYALMEMDPAYEGGLSSTFEQDEQTLFRIHKPTSDGAKYPGLLLFNGPAAIPIGGYGGAVLGPVYLGLWSGADGTPDIGEDVGAASGSWYLSRQGKGFKVKSYDTPQAYYVSSSLRTLWVEPDSNFMEIVRITSATKDGNGHYDGTVQRYDPIALTWVNLYACKVLDING